MNKQDSVIAWGLLLSDAMLKYDISTVIMLLEQRKSDFKNYEFGTYWNESNNTEGHIYLNIHKGEYEEAKNVFLTSRDGDMRRFKYGGFDSYLKGYFFETYPEIGSTR